VDCQRNEIIYAAGKREEAIYIVREGCVKVVTSSAGGKLCIQGIEPSGSILGILSLVDPLRPDTAIAMRRSLLLRVPLVGLLRAKRREEVINALLIYLADRVRAQQHLVNILVTQDSEHRLAVVLLNLARQMGRRRGRELLIEERLSHEDLAAMVGTTRSRIGYFLKSFRTNGLISGDRATLVLDEARVAQFGLGYDDSRPEEQGISFAGVPQQRRYTDGWLTSNIPELAGGL